MEKQCFEYLLSSWMDGLILIINISEWDKSTFRISRRQYSLWISNPLCSYSVLPREHSDSRWGPSQARFLTTHPGGSALPLQVHVAPNFLLEKPSVVNVYAGYTPHSSGSRVLFSHNKSIPQNHSAWPIVKTEVLNLQNWGCVGPLGEHKFQKVQPGKWTANCIHHHLPYTTILHTHNCLQWKHQPNLQNAFILSSNGRNIIYFCFPSLPQRSVKSHFHLSSSAKSWLNSPNSTDLPPSQLNAYRIKTKDLTFNSAWPGVFSWHKYLDGVEKAWVL